MKKQSNYVPVGTRRPVKKSWFDKLISCIIEFVKAVVFLASIPIILSAAVLSLKFMASLQLFSVFICGVIIIVYLFIDNALL